MDLGLQNKVIIVSGGAGRPGSVGETIVRAIAREGGIPVILDIDDRGYQLKDDLAESGSESLFLKGNLKQPEECRRVMEAAYQHYGRIDGIVNNLGSNDSIGLDGSYADFMESLHLNLIHMFLLVKYGLVGLKKTQGAILNVGSKVALTGQGGTSAYAAAKGAVLGLTREWAVDLLKYGIRSNAILPAECWTPSYDDWISTKPDRDQVLEGITRNIPLGNRMTKPEEVADLAVFLISERASHITGQFVFVDGGYVHLDRALNELN